MFEVQDLAVASPATVSRCGMVYLEPSILGLSPFVRCWLRSIPEAIKPHKEQLEMLFSKYLEVGREGRRKGGGEGGKEGGRGRGREGGIE